MSQIQHTFRNADIFKLIADNEPELALKLIDQKLKLEKKTEEQSWLYIYQSWIYYSVYQYYPLTHNALNQVLRNRDELCNSILIEAYLIRALTHIKQGKCLYAYDSVETCLAIDPNNSSAIKLHELILILLKK
ncbi:MAG TPA: hypothetical protein PK784_08200 [Tenuifilaceae bacterium]|nr:hypothetical protein [Tenuifilaceae bacterium]HPN21456.1 hypothetical protein [Tenuifilaceae bacterium]